MLIVILIVIFFYSFKISHARYVITTTDANDIRYTKYIMYQQYIITIAITNTLILVFVMVINSI